MYDLTILLLKNIIIVSLMVLTKKDRIITIYQLGCDSNAFCPIRIGEKKLLGRFKTSLKLVGFFQNHIRHTLLSSIAPNGILWRRFHAQLLLIIWTGEKLENWKDIMDSGSNEPDIEKCQHRLCQRHKQCEGYFTKGIKKVFVFWFPFVVYGII